MEISNEAAKINIDVIKIDSEQTTSQILNVYVKSPKRTKRCSYKFSPTDKEVLQNVDIGIDVESFKSQYLNEVIKDSKPCSYSHNCKHDNKDVGTKVLNTPIDFALEAAKKVSNAKDNMKGIEEDKFEKGRKEEERSERRMKAERKRKRERHVRNITKELGADKETSKKYEIDVEKTRKRMKHSKKGNRKGVERNRKEKLKRKGDRKSLKDEVVVVRTNGGGVKRKIQDLDSEICEKKPKIELDLTPKKRYETEVKDHKTTEALVSSGDEFEMTKQTKKTPKSKSRSKDEKMLRRLKKKEKKNEKYLLKYNKNKSSVKIKLVYKGNDAFDEDTIDLTVHSKKEKKSTKTKHSSKDKEINLKIKFNTEQRKREKTEFLSPNKLKQTVLNFSPENCSSNNVLMKPQHELVLKKKKHHLKKEFLTDSLKQTSIQNFFIKIKTPIKEE